MVEDAELLRRYLESRSEPAFTEFVGRHLNLVYFTALRGTMGDASLAEEVAQGVFALVAHQACKLATHPTLSGWLHLTTRHLAARARRKEQTRQRYEQTAARHHMIMGDAAPDWERLRPVIDDALEELEATEREAILVRFFEGRAFAEMGTAWRISQDAARMRVDRALDKLHRGLERRGIGSMSTALATLLAAQGGVAAPAGLVATVSGGALTASAASAGAATAFAFMSGTKIIAGTATLLALFAGGTALRQHQQAQESQLQLATASREMASLRTQFAAAEQRRTAAEARAKEAETDSGALLAALEAARKPVAATAGGAASATSNANPASASADPLVQTLHALFPNGVVAIVGDRTITVDEVRREIEPMLPDLRRSISDPDRLRQQFYSVQNAAIADLVNRQLNIKEFRYTPPDAAPKNISSEMVDTAVAERIKDRYHNDQAAFLADLNTRGITPGQFRQSIEEEIINAYMRGQQRRPNPSPPEKVKVFKP